MTNKFISAFLLFFFLCAYASPVSAEELEYDKYGLDPTAEESLHDAGEEKNTVEKILDSPAISVRIIKDAIRKGVVWLEDYHVYDKAIHLYDSITDKGIYPYKSDFGDRHGDPAGVEFAYGIYPSKTVTSSEGFFKPVNLQYIKDFSFDESEMFSGTRSQSWLQYGPQRFKDYGTQFLVRDVFGEGNYLRTALRYHDNGQEDFFGEGPNTSLGDGAAFGIEEFSSSVAFGHEFANAWTFETGLSFSSSDISDAKDNKKFPIHSFAGMNGLTGANLVALGLSLERDTRDSATTPRFGGFQRFKVGYYEGVNGDDFGYTKMRFDVAEYLPIGQLVKFLYWDSVLAFRVSGEFNNNLNGDNIPFFDLARLGGPESLRGYQYNRFFDDNSLFYSLEYRYNIWGMKNLKADATLFFDCGWVFDEFSAFEFDQFQDSYGIGLRFLMPRFTIALEGAKSSEGTEVYLKFNPIF